MSDQDNSHDPLSGGMLPEDNKESGNKGNEGKGSTSRTKRRMTETIQKTKDIKENQPKQFKGLIAIAVVVVLMLIGIITYALSSSGRVRQTKPNITSTYDHSPDIEKEFKKFMGSMKEELPKTNARVQDITNTIDTLSSDLEDKLTKMRIEQENNTSAMREQLRELTAAIKEGRVSNQRSTTPATRGDIDTFTQQMKKSKATTGLSLVEARIRINRYLENEGYTESNKDLLRDKILDRVGFLFVGNIEEEPFSKLELTTLPEVLHPHVLALLSINEASARLQGKVVHREKESYEWIKKKLNGNDLKLVTDEDITQAAYIARIRALNVSNEMEAFLPEMVALRDKEGINPQNLFRLEGLVFKYKKSNWPSMEPGQHLALVKSVAGMRTREDQQTGIDALDRGDASASDLPMIQKNIDNAILTGLSQGIRDQSQLYQRGHAAGLAILSNLKLQLDDKSLTRMVYKSIANNLKINQDKTDTTSQDPVQNDPSYGPLKTGKRSNDEQTHARIDYLTLGHIELKRQEAGYFVWLLTNLMAERLDLNPKHPNDAAAISAMWAAAPTLGLSAWDMTYENKGDVKDMVKTLLPSLQKIMDDAARFGNESLFITGVPKEHEQLAQAVLIGQAFGQSGMKVEDEKSQALFRERIKMLKNNETTFDEAMVSADDKSYVYLVNMWKALKLPTVNYSGQRANEIIEIAIKQMGERQVVHQQIVLPDQNRSMNQKLKRELSDALLMSIPAIIAKVDDGNMAGEMLNRIVVSEHNRYIVSYIAESLVSSHGMTLLLERLAPLVDDDNMLPPLYQAMAFWPGEKIHAIIEKTRPEMNDNTVVRVGQDIAEQLYDDFDQFIADEIVYNNIEPRLIQSAGSLNQGSLQKAFTHLRVRLHESEVRPFNIRTIDELTQALHAEAMDVLEGRAEGLRDARKTISSTRQVVSKPLVTGVAVVQIKDEGLPGIPMGMREESVSGSKVKAIPAGAAMQVYLETGAVISIKQSDTGSFVQFRGVGGFFGPSGHFQSFPKCVMHGTMAPNMGADRIDITLTKLVFQLPNGRIVDKEITGVVVDELDGVGGMLARYDRNLRKILPEAGTVALLDGIASGLAAQSTNVEVTTGSTVTTQNASNSVQQGIGEGLQSGVDIVAQYQKQYLDAISPTLESPNGQKLTAYFGSTVEFPELSEADWASFSNNNKGNNDGF